MPGRRRGRRLQIVDENGNRVNPNGDPVPQNDQENVQQDNRPQIRPAEDIEGPRIGPEALRVPHQNANQRQNNQQNVNQLEDDDEPFVFRENIEGLNDQPQVQRNRRNRRLNIEGEDNQPVRNAENDPNVIPNYLEYIEQLQAVEEAKEEATAKMMAAFMTMPPAGGNLPINREEISNAASKLMKQSAFKLMMEDPEAEKLLKQGKGLELISLLAEKQDIVDRDNIRYARGKEKAEEDITFLNDAINSFNEGEAGKKPAEIEKENKYFIEMNKHLDHARMLAGIGEPISGAAVKNLVNATKKYVNGGTKFAGGIKPAAAHKTAMCILSRYMPPEDFKAYCIQISDNPHRNVRRQINPENYTHGRLMGVEKTPQEMRKEYGEKLKKNFSKENVASLVAINNLSRNKNGGLITVVDIDEERSRLLKNGSAFNKAWEDPQNREKYKNIANEGSYALLGREVTRDAQKHSVKASQGVINRSVRTMVSTPLNQYFATEHISNILAAKTLASKADAGLSITNKEFKDHMEMFRKDPFVLQLGARYANDPEFRRQMNHQLSSNNSGDPLLKAYDRLKNPPKPQINRNGPQNENEGQRINQRQAQVFQQIDNLQMPMQ